MTADAPALAPAEDYERHAAAKEARIRALLEAHGLDGLFRGMERCPVERGWRTRAVFYLSMDDRRTVLGVDPRRGRVPIEETLWTVPESARSLVRGLARRIGEVSGDGAITGFELRLEFGSERAHLNVAVERGAASRFDGLAESLRAEFPSLLGIAVPSQEIEAGDVHLRNELLGKTVEAHYRAFFQTNRWLTPRLAAAARDAVRDPSSIVDLYCGVGLHSVLAATPDSRIVSVETNRWAIESAHRNAARHGLAHARYDRTTVEKLIEMESIECPSIVFVNPSRFGCAPGLAEAVARWRPAAVCLVSCSVSSHVRDTLAFLAAGYRPRPFASFDMFPFSDFAESVTAFEPA